MAFPKPLKYTTAQLVRLCLFFCILFLPALASAQIDREFWFVAPNVHDEGARQFNLPINLRITTLASSATVTISMPADASFAPITRNVNANQNITVDLSPWVNQLQNTPANTTLNKGLLITSTADITAYYEVVSGVCNCNPEIFSLKGKNAQGKEFYISSQNTHDESFSYPATNAFDIVATTNNTHITITPSNSIVGHAANVPFTITLNKGQTFSAVASGRAANQHLQGSHVTSDNPVAVTIKDDLVQISSCADLIGDQTVPVTTLGTDYIVTRGFLDNMDEVYVMAVEDGTSVFVDGDTNPLVVLAKGQSRTLNLTNASVYIRGSKNLYVYHLTGNGCEAGSAIIPRLNCTGSRSVSVVRSNAGLFAVMITTKNGNQNSFTVNGDGSLLSPGDFTTVPGTGGAYVTARIDLSGRAAVGQALNFVNSTGNFSLGFLNGGSNDGTRYGFFSDYKSSNVTNSLLETCPGSSVQLEAYGGISYRWTPAAGLSNPNIANPIASPTTTTEYSVEITTADGCVDNSTVRVNVTAGATLKPAVSIASSANGVCVGVPVTFTASPVNGGAAPAYQWKVNNVNVGNNSANFTSATLNNDDRVTCVMTSSSACASPLTASGNTITMIIRGSAAPGISINPSANNICEGTGVSFTAQATNAGNNPVYQWDVNGISTGTNSPNFFNATLVNNDKVTCTLMGVNECGGAYTISSNTVTMIVNPALPASVSIVESQNNICAGTLVTFTATPTNGGTAPTYQWQVNGVNVGTNSATYSSSTLNNNDVVSCQMVSSATCAVPASAPSNTVTMIVTPVVTPAITIAASSNNICPGESITFTATPTNGGTSPAYQWQVNGVNAGGNSATFSSTTLNNNDVVSCILTSSAVCTTSATATDGGIRITVNAKVAPSVSIAASQNNICAGTLVTFTATPTNGGTSPVYQWQVNGVNAGGNSSTFSSSTLNNNDVVGCIITSNAKCAVPVSAPASTITMVVNPALPASVSIAESQNNICAGTLVTFTATPTNGGIAPTYQWQVNGVNVGTNSATFSSSTLNNNDLVSCQMVSSATCAVPASAPSNPVTMIVTPVVTPAITIAASSNNICPGENITFTATPTNGGTAPTYQWQVNGVNAGGNSATFSSTTLNNNDVVSCVLTSSAVCTTSATATDGGIRVTVNARVAPSVSIAASQNNICAGTLVTFTATPTNGGTSPVYQWQVNGVNAGGNSATFSSSTLNNNDIVGCIITSNAKCAVPVSAPASTITMVVNPALPASVSIAESQNNICAGTLVTFTATPTNGGIAPTYQWQVNGVNVGTNSATFSSSTLNNNDLVSCQMVSSATCAVPASAPSNPVTMIVTPVVTPAITIAASSNNICPGENITFTATPTNGGTAPTYQWQVNGVNAGGNSATFSSTTLNNNDVVSCILTSSAVCTTSATATDGGIRVTVNARVAPSVSIAASANDICYGTAVTFTATPVNGGNTPVYQWLVNNVNVSANRNTFTSSTLNNNDVVKCRLTSNAKCAVPTMAISGDITMIVNPLPLVNGGGDKIIEKGNSVQLNATATGNIGDITWSPATGLDNAKTLKPIANPEETTLYTLTVQSVKGCLNVATVKVTVLTHLIIPHAFTPNSDGVNDTWEIGNLTDYPDAIVRVFNRWGSEVWHSKGSIGSWDGTIKGKRLPFGTYYYVINVDKKTPPISGYVALIR